MVDVMMLFVLYYGVILYNGVYFLGFTLRQHLYFMRFSFLSPVLNTMVTCILCYGAIYLPIRVRKNVLQLHNAFIFGIFN